MHCTKYAMTLTCIGLCSTNTYFCFIYIGYIYFLMK